MQTPRQVYPEIIRKKTVVGILWQNLVQYQTWFGSAPYMVHGIQMMPFTPASEFYIQPGNTPHAPEQNAPRAGQRSTHDVGGCTQRGSRRRAAQRSRPLLSLMLTAASPPRP